MKRVVTLAGLSLLASLAVNTAQAQSLVAPSPGICGNQTNLFSFGFPGQLGPSLIAEINDVDGFIGGAEPDQGISFEVFSHALAPNTDPVTEEAFNGLIRGYVVADHTGRAAIAVHLTAPAKPPASPQSIACIHLVPFGFQNNLSVNLTAN